MSSLDNEWSPEDFEYLLSLRASGLTWRECGKRLGRSGQSCRRKIQRDGRGAINAIQEKGVTKSLLSDGSLTASMRTDRVKSVEDLVAVADIDPAEWVVDRYVVNKWEAPNAETDEVQELWQVKAWFKPVDKHYKVREIISDLKEDMANYAPPEYKRGKIVDGRHCVEINIADIHYGMYAWHEDAEANWDSKKAEEVFISALEDLKGRAEGAFEPECYLLPVGNDLLHVDTTVAGKGGATTKGTPQDVDSRYQKMFRGARKMIVDSINILADHAAVYVYIVPGNHDQERVFYLGDSIEAWFRNDDRVIVQNSAAPRKYFKYGQNLIGFAHGHNEKLNNLPIIMAHEVPQWWAATSYREFHIGHRHRKNETQYTPVTDIEGVRVRTFPSLTPNDYWHHSKGYIHCRSSEAVVFHNENGLAGTFAYNITK